MVADRGALILGAAFQVIGLVVFLVATVFDPAGTDPNNHPVTFALYAHNPGWTADHALQFLSEAISVAGVIALFYSLNLPDGMPRLVARIGVVLAAVGLALIAAGLAVDGVVLKRAVDAWVTAPDAEKAARFASAETARWLEEAFTSYQGFVLGAALIVLAALIVRTARLPLPVGLLMALAAVGYLVTGWIAGVSGFAPERQIPAYLAVFSPPIAGVWLLVTAWRMPRQSGR